jgi:hypothetical protein
MWTKEEMDFFIFAASLIRAIDKQKGGLKAALSARSRGRLFLRCRFTPRLLGGATIGATRA